MITKCWGIRAEGGHKAATSSWINSKDLMHSLVITDNNTVLWARHFKRLNLNYPTTIKKWYSYDVIKVIATPQSNCKAQMHQINMLHTLNLHHIVCQVSPLKIKEINWANPEHKSKN